MAVLLSAIRDAGYLVHFAGVGMEQEERATLLPKVDRWVKNFDHRFSRSVRSTGLGQSLSRIVATLRPRTRDEAAPASEEAQSLDRLMDAHWLGQMRTIQARERYVRVLVSYVFHSAFLEAFGQDCLKVLDTHDIFGGRKERLQAEGLTNNWFSTTVDEERHGLLRADRIIAIQDVEQRYFDQLLGGQREIRTVGHMQPARFVDLEVGSRNRIGYFASDNTLNLEGFVWFQEYCWPRIVATCPEARLVVGGRVCRLISAPAQGVELLGEVADPMAFHAKSLFSINPMPGGTGLKIKTVEALAAGRPVIAFEAGAAGLGALVGRGLTVVTSTEDFAQTCLRLLRDPVGTIAVGRSLPVRMEELNATWLDQLRHTLEP